MAVRLTAKVLSGRKDLPNTVLSGGKTPAARTKFSQGRAQGSVNADSPIILRTGAGALRTGAGAWYPLMCATGSASVLQRHETLAEPVAHNPSIHH